MKYLTTLEVAHELKVSKQTLLNWLYAGKVPEPPRNKKGYRLWSASRVSLVHKLIGEGRLHKRTVVHREPSNRPEVVTEFAREVNQFLRDGLVDAPGFIDLHSHADRQIFEMPEAVTQVAQGITTVLVGVDGGGALPVSDFLSRLEREPAALNVGTMVGHGAVRSKVMGDDYR